MLNSIFGQDKALDLLHHSLETHKVSHGYIFKGQSGIGKYLVANYFAGRLLSDGSEEKFASGNHPDYLLIEPEGLSIKTAQIDGFREYVRIRPNEGKLKVILFRSADTLTESAQNKILKVLEEPPAYAVIILIDDLVGRILPTVYSRCQTIEFEKLKIEDLYKIAHSRGFEETEEVKIAANYADGSASLFLKLLEDDSFPGIREDSFLLPTVLSERNFIQASDIVAKYSVKGMTRDNCIDFLNALKYTYRDLLVIKANSHQIVMFNEDKNDTIIALSKIYDDIKIIKSLEIIENAYDEIRSNVNVASSFEAMVVKLSEVING